MQKQTFGGKSAIKIGKGCLLVIILFIVLMAAMAALDGWKRYKSGKSSQNWPSAEGVILTSEVKTDLGKSDDVDSKYTAAINYRYAVEGYEYTGDRVSFGGRFLLFWTDWSFWEGGLCATGPTEGIRRNSIRLSDRPMIRVERAVRRQTQYSGISIFQLPAKRTNL